MNNQVNMVSVEMG